MLPDSHIKFLQDKLQELKSALFFSMSDSILKMPTTVVSTVKVDEVGQIYFFINRPTQYLHEFDREFPARLDFFKKGTRFFVKVIGKACIVDDPEEVNGLKSLHEEIRQNASDQMVLVKVRIQHADYYENADENEITWFQYLKDSFKKWFFNVQPGYRPYSFEPEFANY